MTKIDHHLAEPQQAAEWLRIAGCDKVFFVSAYTGEGLAELMEYLKEEGEIMPWEEARSIDNSM